jgi:molybdopterin-guanine dinucleotide biosynthesis protein A
MGRDKARLRFGRLSLLGHVKKTALRTGLRVRIIRRDNIARCGPLGGIYTALATTRANLLVFLPCDMPFITTKLLLDSLKKLKPSHKALFVSCNELIGFPFILRKDSMPVISKEIKSRRYSLENLAKALDAKILPSPRGWWHQMLNINTRQDLAAARARVGKFRQKARNWPQACLSKPRAFTNVTLC